jgi:hypothetical protein
MAQFVCNLRDKSFGPMIGQYLSNTNKDATVSILQKKIYN